VNGGGLEVVLAGGTVSNATVSGGFLEIGDAASAGGVALSGVIANGGFEVVESGGVASGATIESGGNERVFSGGIASAITLSGGAELVSSGGVAANTTLAGGDMEIASGGLASGAIIFAPGSSDVLQVNAANALSSATISGFSTGDQIILGNVPYSSGDQLALGTNNVLSVTSGGTTLASLTLSPTTSAAASAFILGNAGGDVGITYGATTTLSLPSGNGGLVQASFASTDNHAFQAGILQNFAATLAQSGVTFSDAPTVSPTTTGAPAFAVINPAASSGILAAPITLASGYQGVIDLASAPHTIVGTGGGQESVIAVGGNAVFDAAAGQSGTMIAAAGGNVFAAPTTSGGNWVVQDDGDGANTVSAGASNLLFEDSAGETNTIALGTGADTLGVFGSDSITAASGQDTVFLNGSGTNLQGGSGSDFIVENGVGNSVMGGAGPETIFANAGGNTVTADPTAASSTLFVNQADLYGATTFTAGLGNSTVFNVNGFGVFNAGAGRFVMLDEYGADTVNGAASAAPVTVFGGQQSRLMFNGDAIGNILVAATGNASLNASASGGANVFFDGSAANTYVTMVGGQYYNYFVAGAGNASMTGGQGPNSHNFFQFIDGSAGGDDTIAGWNGSDTIDLIGYGGAQPTTTVYTNGTVLALSDNTHIFVAGVSSIAAGQIHST
jgi:autotransporter passenger strand-loop-strand repeat protein